MNARTFVASIVSLLAGVAFTPWIDEALKVMMLVVFVIITLTINIAFRIPALWNAIVERLSVEVMHRVMMDRDINKLVTMLHKEQIKTIENEGKSRGRER